MRTAALAVLCIFVHAGCGSRAHHAPARTTDAGGATAPAAPARHDAQDLPPSAAGGGGARNASAINSGSPDAGSRDAAAQATNHADAGGSAGATAGSPAVAADAQMPAPDAGAPGLRWTGTIDGHRFPSGSSALTLTFDTLAQGKLTGHVLFGGGGAPPEPSASLQDYDDHIAREGFEYTLRDASLAGGHLVFDIAPDQTWSAYCAAFPSLDVGEGSYACIPSWSFSAMPSDQGMMCYLTNPITRRNEPYDCAQFWFCNRVLGVCKCDAKACRVDDTSRIRFDLQLDGAQLTGTVTGIGSSKREVQLRAD